MRVRKVEVVFHHEAGMWWAEASEGGEHYAASASSLTELRATVAEGLEFMLDEPVEVDERRQTQVTLCHGVGTLVAVTEGGGAVNFTRTPWRFVAGAPLSGWAPRKTAKSTGTDQALAGAGA